MIGLPPGSLIIGLSELGHAGYVHTETPSGHASQVTVALTGKGRAALGHYAATLAQLPPAAVHPPAPGTRAGDADRDAAAAALAEHFAQGRLTLDELIARLDAALTATTHAELARAARDLPADPTAFSGPVGIPRGKRAGSRRRSVVPRTTQ